MSYRDYPPPSPLLIGYDPYSDLAPSHLARLVERSVEDSLGTLSRSPAPGQPAYDPRLCLKVLIYGYATGIRSSRQLERMCRENLAFLFLTRGDTPSYRTLCTARIELMEAFEQVWVSLFAWAKKSGIKRMGRITVDSTKLRADASSESVVRASEFDRIRAELAQILAEADAIDALEDVEGAAVETIIDVEMDPEQMREILRQVRLEMQKEKDAAAAEPGSDTAIVPGRRKPKAKPKKDPGEDGQQTLSLIRRVSPRMRKRLKAGIEALEMATAKGLGHVSLTDPDARMMPEGCQKRIRECHSYEVAVDQGLIVASGATQVGVDNKRLGDLIEAARENEPSGVLAVTADSGYYSGDSVAALMYAGVDTCIPDAGTAGDLHRGNPAGTGRAAVTGSVGFDYDAERDIYTCPQDNELRFVQRRQKNGQMIKVYRADQDCRGCPLADHCLTQKSARRRNLHVGDHHVMLEAARARFDEPDHRKRYHQRGPQVETVFAFLRSALGYNRWHLRGAYKVACEAQLFTLAYQMRKISAAGA